MSASQSRVARWERRAELPLAALAALFLAAYAWPILDPALATWARRLCDWADAVIWVVFVLEYAGRLFLADRRRAYFVRHLLDLVIVALPVLRPLRMLRIVMLLTALDRKVVKSLHGRIAVYVSFSAVVLVFCAALAVLDAERGHAGGNITDFGTALWWAVVTVSTVGYGDHYPVTGQGQAIGAGLMIGGVALLGVVTATFAAYLVERVREIDEAQQTATRADIRALHAEVTALRAALAQDGSTLGEQAPLGHTLGSQAPLGHTLGSQAPLGH